MSNIPRLAEQFILGKKYTFRKPSADLTVSGHVEGIDRQSPTGNLAITNVRIDGFGWISLQDWVIQGEEND